jgi:hypothetical protein
MGCFAWPVKAAGSTGLEEGNGIHTNILGREVEIYEDTAEDDPGKIAEGRVTAIGDNLELFIPGREKPVKRGRLAIKEQFGLDNHGADDYTL